MNIQIIAEIGVNHNGDVELAKELIRKARECGADFVKFQTFKPEKTISSLAKLAPYQERAFGKVKSQLEMVRKFELSESDHIELVNEANSSNIKFLSTAFDKESFLMLKSLGVTSHVKISSTDVNNLPLLEYVSKGNVPLFLSTGMSTIEDVSKAIETIEKSGTSRQKITIMQCNTEYPTPIEDVNLLAMVNMGKKFNLSFGYSDHTEGIEVCIAAAALGATVLEKHFTLDKSLKGPDHHASIEPDELTSLVRAVRNIEKALGDGIKRVTESEKKNIAVARRSIIADKPIKKGEAFSEENITTKRPGTGISPMRWHEIIGKKAIRNFEKDEIIEL